MLPPPVDLPIRFLVHSTTLPLRAGVSGVVWGGRTVTWFRDKYSAHQAHRARLGFTRYLLDKHPDVLGNFSTFFDSSNQGADRQQEVNKVLDRIGICVESIKSNENVILKNRSALSDREGFRKILLNEEHFSSKKRNNPSKLIKVKINKNPDRAGFPLDFATKLLDGVCSNFNKTYEFERDATNKLNLFIPTKAPAQGEPVKVLIEAHGVTEDNQFTVKEQGLKLKFFSGPGEKLVFAPLTPFTELAVEEAQELPSGSKTLDYTLTAFSGARSACRVTHDGKTYEDESVPEDLRRKVVPIIHQTDDNLLVYAKNTNTIVVSPKLADQNDERVRIKLSEIYTVLQKRYPNNPLEISCKFCRSIPD